MVERATRHIRLVGIGAGSRAREARALQPIETLYTRLRARSGQGEVDLTALLPGCHRLLIEGQPGAGKTTFANLVACMLARDCKGMPCPEGPPWRTAHLGLPADQPARIPVLLRAANLALRMQERTQREDNRHWLLDLVEKYCTDNKVPVPADTWQALLLAGDAFVLIDGLDEVADEALRQRIFAVFDDACTTWTKCPFVVTSRPVQTEHLRQTHGFDHTTIAPFGRGEIDAFLQAFAQAMHGESAATEAGAYLAELRGALLQRRDLRLLASNPVMLTCLCVVHWNDGQLPHGRARVYRSVIDWLLRSKREARAEQGYNDTFALAAFSRLALAMMTHAGGKQKSIGLEDAACAVDAAVERHFPKLSDERDRRALARRWLRYECLGSGIVQELADGRLEFWHLTFQEYLAACELALGRDEPEHKDAWWPTFRDHLEDPQWRETVDLFPACLFGDRDQGRVDRLLALVQGLERREDETELAHDARRAGLVGRLLSTVEVLGYVPDAAIRGEHQRALARTMAMFTVEGAAQVPWRERVAAAEALGRAGDPRLGDGRFLQNLRPIPGGGGWRLGVYPVTVAEYLTFVEDDGYRRQEWWGEDWEVREKEGWVEPRDFDEQLQHPNWPVTGVSWHEACAYCRWMAARYEVEVRLPQGREWAQAATPMHGPYPWGMAEPDEKRANFDQRVGRPTPVGIYPSGAGPSGHLDLAGNVWEWCVNTLDEEPYGSRKPSGRDPGSRALERVLRGGGWDGPAPNLRSGYRGWNDSWYRSAGVGFRVAVAPSSTEAQTTSP